MSLQITLATQGAAYRGLSESQTAFTVIVRVRIDSTMPDVRTILSLHTNGNSVHEVYCTADGSEWTVQTDFGATSVAMQGSGQSQALNTFYDLALVGASSSGTKLRAYIKAASDSTAREYEIVNGTSGTINHVHLGSPYSGYQALATYSNLKAYSRALTKAEVETEMNSQAVVVTTNRVCYNDFIGADIAAVMTSDFGSSPWGAMASLDPSGVALVAPIRSTSEPSWSTATFVVAPTSSPLLLPDEAPTSATSIGIVQFALAPSEGQSPAPWATPSAAPGYNNVLIAAFGGWTENPTTITVDDDGAGLTWTQRLSEQYTPAGNGAHLVVWTAPVTKAKSTFRARPVTTGAAAPPYASFALVEVERANLSTLIDGTPVDATGSSTAPTVDHANTTNANNRMFGFLTWGNSGTSLSAWGGAYTGLLVKNGGAALAIASRAVTATGNYDPSATLDVSSTWIAGALALQQQASATAPNITTTTIAEQPDATAGALQIAATGSGPITFTISGAPSGVDITAGGYLTWPATLSSQAYTFNVIATNLNGSDTQSLTLQIGSPPTAPTILTTSIPPFKVGVANGWPLLASGTGPFTWYTTSTLPAGITVSGSTIGGTATAEFSGSVTLTVEGPGGSSQAASQTYTVTVLPADDPTPPTTSDWVRLPRGTETWVRIPRAT